MTGNMDMMNERERIGARIAELRKSLGMTQEDLAGKCGLQRTTVSKIERGTVPHLRSVGRKN